MPSWLIALLVRVAIGAGLFGAGWVVHWWDAREACNTVALRSEIDELKKAAERDATALAIAKSSRLTLHTRIEIVGTQARAARERFEHAMVVDPVAGCRLPERVHAVPSEAIAAAIGRVRRAADQVHP
jgi:hypothetical protein